MAPTTPAIMAVIMAMAPTMAHTRHTMAHTMAARTPTPTTATATATVTLTATALTAAGGKRVIGHFFRNILVWFDNSWMCNGP